MNISDFVNRLRNAIEENYTSSIGHLIERAGMDQLKDRETCGYLRAHREIREMIDQTFRQMNGDYSSKPNESNPHDLESAYDERRPDHIV